MGLEVGVGVGGRVGVVEGRGFGGGCVGRGCGGGGGV